MIVKSHPARALHSSHYVVYTRLAHHHFFLFLSENKASTGVISSTFKVSRFKEEQEEEEQEEMVVVVVRFISCFRRCSFSKKILSKDIECPRRKNGWNGVVFAVRDAHDGSATRSYSTGLERDGEGGERDIIFFERRLVVRVDLQAGGSKRRPNARGLAIEDNGKEAEYDYRIYDETEKEGQTDKMR